MSAGQRLQAGLAMASLRRHGAQSPRNEFRRATCRHWMCRSRSRSWPRPADPEGPRYSGLCVAPMYPSVPRGLRRSQVAGPEGDLRSVFACGSSRETSPSPPHNWAAAGGVSGSPPTLDGVIPSRPEEGRTAHLDHECPTHTRAFVVLHEVSTDQRCAGPGRVGLFDRLDKP